MVRRGIGSNGVAKSRSRGVAVIVFFLVSLVAASALAGSLLSSRPSLPQERPLSRLDRAKIALADGDLAAAEKVLANIEGDEARTLRAKIHLKRGRLSEARAIFSALWKKNPENTDALEGMAQVYTAIGQDRLALPFWRRLADLRPEDAAAWRELGLAQIRLDDSASAFLSLQNSLRLDAGQEDLSILLAKTASRAPDRKAVAGTVSSAGARGGPRIPDPNRFFPKAPWRNR